MMEPSIFDERPRQMPDPAGAPKASLGSELSEIYKHAQSAEEIHRWADNLTNLRYEPSTPTRFRKVINSAPHRREFVAVSYTWPVSSHEDPGEDGYTVLAPSRERGGYSERREEKLDIGNHVLDRAVKYLQASDQELFWIDKGCIDQHNPVEKTRAMNAMHLVYKEAKSIVGLLSSPVLTDIDAQLLASLLDGDLIEEHSPRQCRLSHDVDEKTVCETVRVLRSILDDRWWRKGWIYQEEYFSGTRIRLLIPVDAGVRVPSGYSKVGGEFCVPATAFRERATTFLLACSASRYRSTCLDLLWGVEKYIITPKRDHGSLKPMFASVVEDIQRRDLRDPWAILTITANVCGYRRRLDAETLKNKQHSLNHCLLALFLLNDEIFSGRHRHDMSLLDDNISNFNKDQIQPSFGDLPVPRGGLTFLKYCRLPYVKICERGVETEGYTWELPENAGIDTAHFVLPKLSDIPNEIRKRLEDEPWSSSELEMLVDELDRCEQWELVHKLSDCMRQAKREKEREGKREARRKPRRALICGQIQGSDGMQANASDQPGANTIGISSRG